jgi:hypothetical protein
MCPLQERRENAVRVQKAVYANKVSSSLENQTTSQEYFDHMRALREALSAERKQRLREVRLAKDSYRVVQSDIRVKIPVRACVFLL